MRKISFTIIHKAIDSYEEIAVPEKLSPDALRMRRLRTALGYKSATEFARFLGISKAHWSNFENGYPLPRQMMYLLCEKIDWLTSDWLYFGRTGGIPEDKVKLLAEPIPNGPATKRRKRRR